MSRCCQAVAALSRPAATWNNGTRPGDHTEASGAQRSLHGGADRGRLEGSQLAPVRPCPADRPVVHVPVLTGQKAVTRGDQTGLCGVLTVYRRDRQTRYCRHRRSGRSPRFMATGPAKLIDNAIVEFMHGDVDPGAQPQGPRQPRPWRPPGAEVRYGDSEALERPLAIARCGTRGPSISTFLSRRALVTSGKTPLFRDGLARLPHFSQRRWGSAVAESFPTNLAGSGAYVATRVCQ
jgi:hypothetical protein